MAKLVEILARELEEWPESAGNICSQDSDREARFEQTWFDFYLSELADDAAMGGDYGGGVQVTRAEWQAAVDALKAKPEIIGHWKPKENNLHNKPFSVLSRRKSEYEVGAWEGEKDDGSAYHVFSEYWEWIPVNHAAPEWDGVGLPPVGAVVNIRFQEYTTSSPHPVRILHISERKVFYKYQATGEEFSHLIKELEFSIVRTPEQIEAEEREKAACELYCTINRRGGALEWKNQSVGRRDDYFRAIDAGYRKQEPK